jgi:hypothetical protein
LLHLVTPILFFKKFQDPHHRRHLDERTRLPSLSQNRRDGNPHRHRDERREYIDQNTGLLASTQYFYKVCANNSAGDSAFSSEVLVKPIAPNLTFSATFVGLDSTNAGNWNGVHGAHGNWIYTATPQLCASDTFTPGAVSEWVWDYAVNDPAALVLPGATNTEERFGGPVSPLRFSEGPVGDRCCRPARCGVGRRWSWRRRWWPIGGSRRGR